MFSEQQLKEIKFAAKHTKNQGELRVYLYAVSQPSINGWTEQQINVFKYCAEECKRQHSGEMSVYDMVNAWSMVQERKAEDWNPDFQLTTSFIEYIGQIVEPIDNKKGFRTIPIGVWQDNIWHDKAKWEEVPRLLTILLEVFYEGRLGPHDWYTSKVGKLIESAEDEFYYEFEQIHPFVDGNGRTGKILYNYLKGTLDNPVLPPNFYGEGANP